MIDVVWIVIEGLVYSSILSLIVMSAIYHNPRIELHNYPKDVQGAVHPQTEREKRQTSVVGIIFIVILSGFPFVSTMLLKQEPSRLSLSDAFINAFGIAFIFNLVDLVILYWLIACTITPRFLVIPGTEGMKGYKDYRMHVRGFIAGIVL